MNESIFLLHVLVVLGFVLASLRLGKGALIALISLQGVLANLFVVKQMFFLGFSVTCSDVFAIGGILSLNLLQEYYGKEAAKQAVNISLLTLLFFAFMSQIHLLYAPTVSDTTHGAFQTIFSQSVRIVFSSIGTFYLIQQFDVRFFGLLKGALPVRVALSLLSSQLLDTILFSFFGLYGLVESLFDIILVSFLIKCLIIALSSPFVAFSKRFVRGDVSV
ncbi:MAG: queuosine precursor transporter [Chlamydiales bacterium]